MNELSIVIFMVIAGALWALMAYSVGFKQGEREGFLKGRAISRHASSREFYALPSDVKEVNS